MIEIKEGDERLFAFAEGIARIRAIGTDDLVGKLFILDGSELEISEPERPE
ncbi:hypothetical protein D3C87_1936830 [compost metagenome]